MRHLRLYELKLTLLVVHRHFSSKAENVDFCPTRMHVSACMVHKFKTGFGDPYAPLGEQATWRHLGTAHHVIHSARKRDSCSDMSRDFRDRDEHAFTGLFGPCRAATGARTAL